MLVLTAQVSFMRHGMKSVMRKAIEFASRVIAVLYYGQRTPGGRYTREVMSQVTLQSQRLPKLPQRYVQIASGQRLTLTDHDMS